MIQRTQFGKLKAVIDPPDLIDIQRRSYDDFLQIAVASSKRKRQGLEAVFREVFPSRATTGGTCSTS